MSKSEVVLGEEKEGAEAEPVVAGSDAVALAVAMDAARYDPELARKAGNYLDEHHLLVTLQAKHFDEERRLAIAAAKRKRYADRIRNGLATFVAGVAGIVVIAAGVMVWNARNDHGLVVEAFSVPPDFEARGITGRVVAAEVLDRINTLPSQTRISRPEGSYRNNWGDDIKVEIPNTGISIGELARILHDKLGHATRIEGNVTRTATGLSVAARIHDSRAIKVVGPEPNLDDLINKVAEQAYASTQPYRYGNLLFNDRRYSEALTIFRGLAVQGPPEERPWGWVGVGNVSLETSGFQEGFAALRQALKLDLDQAIACSNLAFTGRGVGLAEEALTAAHHCYSISPRAMALKFTAAAIAWDRLFLQYNIASDLGDHQSAARFIERMVSSTEFRSGAEKAYGGLEREELALDHDTSGPQSQFSDIEITKGLQPASDYFVAMPNVLMAFERADYGLVVSLSENLIKALKQPDVVRVNQEQIQRRVYPILAQALARLGRDAEADVLLKDIPDDDYDGWLARGRIAMLRRDFAAGDSAFAAAVRQAPSIPSAYCDWGDLLAAKGDAGGAIAEYTAANQRGRHFADALKGWGDVLARQNDKSGAIAKYDEALKYAPNWAALKEARKAVAK